MQPSPGTSPQLSEENLRQLATARSAFRKIKRAVTMALFDGWSIVVCAILTLLISIGDPLGMLAAAVLGVIGFFELRGASQLRQLQVQGAKTLGINQLTLGGLIILYSLWQMHSALSGQGPLAEATGQDAQMQQILAPYEGLSQSIAIMLYSTLVAVAILYMGGMAMFYFSRRKVVIDYIAQTPDWIISMQKTGVSP